MIKGITSTAVPLQTENIDTDQIIPAEFLKAVTRSGFGDKLFYAWRKKPNSILNDKRYKGKILVAGANFGCGSSREHAAWALYDYGFRVVVSSFFADIFKNNALNNQLLPVVVSEDFLKKTLSFISKNPKEIIRVDIENQSISIPAIKIQESFNINPYKKDCLIYGHNDLDYLLNMKSYILKYEKENRHITG